MKPDKVPRNMDELSAADADFSAFAAASGLPTSFGFQPRSKKVKPPKRKHFCKGVMPQLVAALPAPGPKLPMPFPHSRVLAPMVTQCDLAFRLLCRAHGADLCYTEMLHSARLVAEPEYRQSLLLSQLLPGRTEGPLIVQLSGNSVETIVVRAFESLGSRLFPPRFFWEDALSSCELSLTLLLPVEIQ